MLTLHNPHLRVEIDPDRGAEITALRRPSTDPAGHPRHGPNALAHHPDWPTREEPEHADSETRWLAGYRGGWQETAPNAGDASTAPSGVALPFHGEASALPWTVLDAGEDRCTLQVTLRLPLTLTRTMRLHPDRPTLQIESTLTSTADEQQEFVWGHHPLFPLLPGTRLDVGACPYTTEQREAGDLASTDGTWPHATSRSGHPVDLGRTPPRPGTMRLVYLHDTPRPWALVRQPAGQPSVALAWDPEAFPVTWLWQIHEEPGFPWYGRMSAVGVEPQTAWPYDGLAGAVRRGQAHRLGPGRSATSWFTVTLLDRDPGPVTAVTRDGRLTTAPTAPPEEDATP